MALKQIRNGIFAGLSGAVVLMAFANNLHDVVQRWWPGPVQGNLHQSAQTKLTAIPSAQAADQAHPPNLRQRLQALVSSPKTLYVAPNGDDQQEGTPAQPLQTLAQALAMVSKAQIEEPQAQFTIQLAAGEFGDAAVSEPLVIPPGVTLKGQGKATQLQQSLLLHHPGQVSQLSFSGAGILVNPTAATSGKISLSQLDISQGFLTIKATAPQPYPKIQIQQITMADSCILVSGGAKPEIRDVQMRGNVGVDEFSLAHCSEHGLLASGTRMPLIQLLGAAYLENIVVSQTNLALFNQAEGSVIKNLRIVNSLSGVDNTGSLSLERLHLQGLAYTGVCNQGTLTLHQPGFDSSRSAVECLTPGLDAPPPTPINLAGNLDTITVH